MKLVKERIQDNSSGIRRTILIAISFLMAVDIAFYGIATATDTDTAPGSITGQLVDEQTGEPLIGVTVMLENTVLGAASDLDGRYSISKIPPGTYNLIVRLIGYSTVTVKSVRVNEKQTTHINLSMSSEAYKSQDIVVIARNIENTEAALLKDRQRSNSISDAISAESIEHSGSGNAAEAMTQVTGASVVDGKYVFIRGLGDRYSNAQLNGSELPSSDPDQNAFQMDLLPSNMLDNIVVIKSFTADQPGNFSGGIIDIDTKTFPESFSLKFSSSSSYNTQATFNNGFLTYQGGRLDWLGIDDGTRSIPGDLQNASVPDISFAFTNPTQAHLLDTYSKSFNSTMAPITKAAPINQSYAFSIGNKINLHGRQLGYLASINYGHRYLYYNNGQVGRWRLSGNTGEATSLTKDFYLSDSQGKSEVNWGGLFMTSYKLNNNNEIGTNLIYSKSGESEARYLSGKFYDGNLPPDATYETRVLKFTERTLESLQLNGRHHFGSGSGIDLDWNGTLARNTQAEPDLRYFSDHYTVSSDGDTSYTIRPAIYTVPQRYFRDLSETHAALDFKLSIPFTQWSDLSGKFRLGGLMSYKKRDSNERIFEYQNQDPNLYNGNPQDFFSDNNTGIIDSSGGIYTFGNYIVDASEARSNYKGDQTIAATFGMLESPISERLRFIGGLRFEKTKIDVVTEDLSYIPGKLDNNDLLPSASLIYQLDNRTNLRAAYGRTLARPTFRELAPFPSWDFANGYYFIGNPDLERTLIDNLDLRLEWFSSPGEILAASVFTKRFQNPIERAIKNDNGEIQYQNVDRANVYGLELEFRQKLDKIHSYFANFLFGGNFSLIRSRVDIPESEMVIIRTYDPHADGTRPLQGQSPYLLNLDLTYDNAISNTMASLSFNVFGERLSEVSLGGTPDVYELPRPDFDLVMTQKVLGGLQMKFSAKNILDSSVKKVHHFKGNDYIYQTYKQGRTFLVGLSYDIE